jgi:hypothetical protein
LASRRAANKLQDKRHVGAHALESCTCTHPPVPGTTWLATLPATEAVEALFRTPTTSFPRAKSSDLKRDVACARCTVASAWRSLVCSPVSSLANRSNDKPLPQHRTFLIVHSRVKQVHKVTAATPLPDRLQLRWTHHMGRSSPHSQVCSSY